MIRKKIRKMGLIVLSASLLQGAIPLQIFAEELTDDMKVEQEYSVNTIELENEFYNDLIFLEEIDDEQLEEELQRIVEYYQLELDDEDQLISLNEMTIDPTLISEDTMSLVIAFIHSMVQDEEDKLFVETDNEEKETVNHENEDELQKDLVIEEAIDLKEEPEVNDVEEEAGELKEEIIEEQTVIQSAPAMRSFMTTTSVASINELNSTAATVAYNAVISGTNGSLYTRPITQSGSVLIKPLSAELNSNVIVRREITISGDDWILVEKNGTNLGWMRKHHMTPRYDTIVSEQTVAYNGRLITDGRYQIFSRPAYTEGNYQVFDSSQHTNASIIVRGIIDTGKSKWFYIERSGKELGWINSNAVKISHQGITSEKVVAYNATVITDGRYQIFNRPAYTKNNYHTHDSSTLTAASVIVRGEIDLGNSTWVLIERNGRELGWINKLAITPSYNPVSAETTVVYNASISTNGRYQIFNRPAYTLGNYQVADSARYRGASLIVRSEMRSGNATWALIERNGKELGWINKQALTPSYERVVSSRPLNHPRIIESDRFQIFSVPAYTEGNRQVANSSDFKGQVVLVVAERVTERRTWQQISVNGRVIGWINRDALRKPLVYIDPGHGGRDPGPVYGGTSEARLNLATAQYLRNKIPGQYYDVVMARNSDMFLSLAQRAQHANKLKADIFVSIHYNAMGVPNSNARGIETFIYHRVASGFGQETNRNNFRTDDLRIRESLRLADAMHPLLISRTGRYDRGIKGNNFHVLRETNMPAVLLELGFMDNPSELEVVRSISFRHKATQAVADGIDRYFRQ